MSQIPFFFRSMPDEFMTDEFLGDLPMMKLIRYILRRVRSKPHQEKFYNNRTQILLDLDAWHFVFGREKAMEECNCSEKIIRNRMDQLRASSYLEEIRLDTISKGHFSTVRASSSEQKRASSSEQKRASTFSVYRLRTESFSQIKGQQLSEEKGQQFFEKKGTGEGHKQEEQEFCPFVKETSKEDFVVPLSPSGEQKKDNEVPAEQIEGVFVFLENIGHRTPTPVIRRWLRVFGEERLINNINLVLKQNTFTNFGASVTDACKGDYAKQAENMLINREFAISFKATNKIVSLKLTKKYCVDENGNDYQYNLDPEQFKETLERKFNVL